MRLAGEHSLRCPLHPRSQPRIVGGIVGTILSSWLTKVVTAIQRRSSEHRRHRDDRQSVGHDPRGARRKRATHGVAVQKVGQPWTAPAKPRQEGRWRVRGGRADSNRAVGDRTAIQKHPHTWHRHQPPHDHGTGQAFRAGVLRVLGHCHLVAGVGSRIDRESPPVKFLRQARDGRRA